MIDILRRFPLRSTVHLGVNLVLACLFAVLLPAHAQAELYIQDESRSPDGSVVFAINYPPTEPHPYDYAQGCFLDRKTKKRIGAYFPLPSTTADIDHPGTYSFDNYNVFDYVWSADSRCVAIVHNLRRFSVVLPFRRNGAGFQSLEMPDMYTPLTERLAGVLQKGLNTSAHAKRWLPNHHLVATIAKDAQVTNTGDESKDWKSHSLEFTIAFDTAGKPTVKATKFRIRSEP